MQSYFRTNCILLLLFKHGINSVVYSILQSSCFSLWEEKKYALLGRQNVLYLHFTPPPVNWNPGLLIFWCFSNRLAFWYPSFSSRLENTHISPFRGLLLTNFGSWNTLWKGLQVALPTQALLQSFLYFFIHVTLINTYVSTSKGAAVTRTSGITFWPFYQSFFFLMHKGSHFQIWKFGLAHCPQFVTFIYKECWNLPLGTWYFQNFRLMLRKNGYIASRKNGKSSNVANDQFSCSFQSLVNKLFYKMSISVKNVVIHLIKPSKY